MWYSKVPDTGLIWNHILFWSHTSKQTYSHTILMTLLVSAKGSAATKAFLWTSALDTSPIRPARARDITYALHIPDFLFF